MVGRRNMTRALLSPVLATLVALSPCGDAPRVGPGASAQSGAGISNRATETAGSDSARADRAGAEQAAAPDVPIVVRPRPLVSPVTRPMVEAMRAIADRDPSLRSDVFAKMGGSSVVNRGFLHCFEDEPTIDFRGQDLDATWRYFREARIGTRSPYARTSLAAAVGWSIRHALGGRPAYVLQEIRATRARFALAFFGSNDVEGRNAHQFAGRLDRLVTTLAERGVIPIVGATYPRRANDPDMNEQVRRYNRMSHALAMVHGLPYVDFHQAMLPLPGRGLAADGYHPNTYLVGPRSRGCDFGDEGMRHGNNQRNLLTMKALDAVRRAVVADEPAAAPEPSASGEGTEASPLRPTSFPFAHRVAFEALPAGETVPSESCGAGALPSRSLRVRFTLAQPMRVRASAVAMGPLETHLSVRRVGDPRCLGNGEDEQVLALEPGTHELVVFAARMRRVPQDQATTPMRLLVVLDEEPTRPSR